jgi:hypothetical protein
MRLSKAHQLIAQSMATQTILLTESLENASTVEVQKPKSEKLTNKSIHLQLGVILKDSDFNHDTH